MIDTVTVDMRSLMMSKIRREHTMPEIIVRKLLFAAGFRYRLHVANLPGKPDIVFKKRRKVIFVHGCFWHQHENCRKGVVPKTREDFWNAKLLRNKKRDIENVRSLISCGWDVLIVWECELKDRESLRHRLVSFLHANRYFCDESSFAEHI